MTHLTLRNHLEIDPHISVCFSGLTIRMIHPTLNIFDIGVWTQIRRQTFINPHIFLHPFFVWVVLLPLTLYVFLPSGESMAVHCYKGIMFIILTLAYQVTILMIIHRTFGLVFLHLFSLPLDTLWQQQISMVENSLFKMKSYYLFRMLQQQPKPK